jgi:hypothetical protein
MTLILGFMVVGVLVVLGVIFDSDRARVVWAWIGITLLLTICTVMLVGSNAVEARDVERAATREAARMRAAEVAARPLNWGLPLIKVYSE